MNLFRAIFPLVSQQNVLDLGAGGGWAPGNLPWSSDILEKKKNGIFEAS